MNMKNISLFIMLLPGFMVIGAEKPNVNVLNQLNELDKQAQNDERTYRPRLSHLSKLLKQKNAYIENPKYKELEELRIQQYSDLYVRDLARVYRDTGKLEIDEEGYRNVRDIKTKEGKTKLAEAMKATYAKVANIIAASEQ